MSTSKNQQDKRQEIDVTAQPTPQKTISVHTTDPREYRRLYEELLQEKNALEEKLAFVETQYYTVSTSFFWRLTKPMRVTMDWIKKQLKKNRFTYKFCRGLKCLKQNGFRSTSGWAASLPSARHSSQFA